ncbi:hypothetical protein, partial [Bacillus thuringiensis]|uniref:hypothetical protein n=1 Tax=Bacillus thuringiensis TaxID=1428 RepID=UPI001C92C0D5
GWIEGDIWVDMEVELDVVMDVELKMLVNVEGLFEGFVVVYYLVGLVVLWFEYEWDRRMDS